MFYQGFDSRRGFENPGGDMENGEFCRCRGFEIVRQSDGPPACLTRDNLDMRVVIDCLKIDIHIYTIGNRLMRRIKVTIVTKSSIYCIVQKSQ